MTHAVRCPVALPPGVTERGDDPRALIRALFLAEIGWKLGARGPLLFDCYSITQLVQWHLFGRAMMNVDLASDAGRREIVAAMRHHDAFSQWKVLEGRGRHGDPLYMAHRDDPWHIGTYLDLDRGVVVHCSEQQGLRVDSLTDLEATGWHSFTWFSFAGETA